jgi:DNA polymerase-3 subunit alpha
MKNAPRFIHLRTHTEYSLLEGAIRLKKLPDLCKLHDMPAVAVTDTNNLFAALEFSVGLSGAGIQPIVGCQVDMTYLSVQPGERAKTPAPLVLLAQTEQGYLNLMKLNLTRKVTHERVCILSFCGLRNCRRTVHSH